MATKPKIKKQRITILLDEDIVNEFKRLAEADERPYQPLMNKVLREYIQEQKNAAELKQMLERFKPSVDA